MGGTRYWLRNKKSKQEKGNQRKKSSKGNVERNSSGTSTSQNHLRASDGSCLDVCSRKGHSFPVKAWEAWDPMPERTTSLSEMQQDIGSEASYEKTKNSTVQLKFSPNVRTNSSLQDIKSATPAVRNLTSALKLKRSLDLNNSPEPPGIVKTEIPLLYKKFNVIDRYPSDNKILKYNESVISSPNSSSGSTGKLGSPSSSPTTLLGLDGVRKTVIQSRDIMGTSKITTKRTTLSMEPFGSRVVSPFGRKFSTRGLFSSAHDQKKGDAESKKSPNEDQVSVKKLDIVEPPIANKILERMQSDSINKIYPPISPFSRSAVKDMDQTKNLCVDDASAEKEMLKSMQINVHSQISPSVSTLSPPAVNLTKDNDRAKISHMNDAANKEEMLELVQTNGHSQISPSTSPLYKSDVKLTHEKDQQKDLHVDDATTENEMMLEPLHNNFHIQISPSISPLYKSDVKLTREKDLHVDDATTVIAVLEPKQNDHIQISASNYPLSQSDEKRNFDDQAKIFDMTDVAYKNEMLEPVQTDGHSHIAPSTSFLSDYGVTLIYDNDRINFLHVNDTAAENEMLESIQSEDHSQISPFTSPLSRPAMKLTHDNDGTQIIHVNGASTENELLEPLQTDGDIEISPCTSQLSKSVLKTIHNEDQKKILHVDAAAIENHILEAAETDGYPVISPSTSLLSNSATKFIIDKDHIKKLRLDDMLEPKQTDGIIQISPSSSPLSQSDGKLTFDNHQAKKLQDDDAETENELLETAQIDFYSQISPSTSPLSKLDMKLAFEKNHIKNLHMDDATIKNKVLEPKQTVDLIQISPFTSQLSQSDDKPNDQTKILHIVDVTSENEMLTHSLSQVSLDTSSLSQSTVKLTHDDDQAKILHVVDATENEMLESQGHIQNSKSISPLPQLSVNHTHDNDEAKILHVVDTTKNDMLKPVQDDGHFQISKSTSSLFRSHVLSNARSECFPSHAHISAEPECTDVEDTELCDFEYIYSYDSEDSEYAEEIDEINLKNDYVVNINKFNAPKGMHHRNSIEDKEFTSEDKDSPVFRCKFRRGRTGDLQSENDVPRKLKFRQEQVVKNGNGTKTYVGMRGFQKRGTVDSESATSPDSKYTESYDSEDCDYADGELDSEGCDYADGELDGFKAGNSDVLNISRVDTLKGEHHRNPRNNKQFPSEEEHLGFECKFRRGKMVGLQSENDVPKKFKFRPGRLVEDDGTKTYAGRIRFKDREIVRNTNETSNGDAYIDSYCSEDSEYTESETIEFNPENDDVVNINKVDLLEGKHHKNRKGKQCTCEEYSPAYKCKFRRGRIVDLQTENDIPRRLMFRRGRVIENDDGTKTYIERIRFKKREIVDNTSTTSPGSEYNNSYYSEDSEYAESETVKFSYENGGVVNKVGILEGKHDRNSRKDRHFTFQEDSPAYKCKFMRGKIVDLQIHNDVPRRLKFRPIENDDDTKTYVRRKRFKMRDIINNINVSSPDSQKVILRHREMEEKKDEMCLFNDVIEETVTKLSRIRKSKVKALVGAFETVISLQDDKTPPGE